MGTRSAAFSKAMTRGFGAAGLAVLVSLPAAAIPFSSSTSGVENSITNAPFAGPIVPTEGQTPTIGNIVETDRIFPLDSDANRTPNATFSFTGNFLPEPSTLVLIGVALVAVALYRPRKHRSRKEPSVPPSPARRP